MAVYMLKFFLYDMYGILITASPCSFQFETEKWVLSFLAEYIRNFLYMLNAYSAISISIEFRC